MNDKLCIYLSRSGYLLLALSLICCKKKKLSKWEDFKFHDNLHVNLCIKHVTLDMLCLVYSTIKLNDRYDI